MDYSFKIDVRSVSGTGNVDPSNGGSETLSCAQDNNRKRKSSCYFPIIGCFRVEEGEEGNFDASVDVAGEPSNPSHLVVMVNGVMSSAQNWSYAAKQFLLHFPREVIVHCSEVNSSTSTFHGIDVMGERLATEVISVIERYPSVNRISFIGHSLGGLVARYAIAKLYKQDPVKEASQGNGELDGIQYGCGYNDDGIQYGVKRTIAGLEPVNFITLATPHLGLRWHKQMPLLCGFPPLEKMASSISWILGRTGKHIFLADGANGKPPLLFQMVSDSEDLKYMSALQSFKRHVSYASVDLDHLVGWCTASLRHPHELPKRRHLSRDEKYRHIVHVETPITSSSEHEYVITTKASGYIMEEEMLQALTKLIWERVDVKFNGWKQNFLAHNTILFARNFCLFADGADVIQHMIDHFVL